MDKNELHEILSKPFDHEAWLELLKSVFGVRELFTQPHPIILPDTKKAKAAFELGNFTTSDDRVIGLYKVEMMPGIRLERNKAGLRTFLSIFRNTHRYDVDGALIVFEQGEKWRLSYVSEIKVLNADGEVVSQATEPKRYTYLLGPGEKVLTPANQLSKLKGKSLTLEDIRNAFSVEALNEAFYKIIAEQFYQLAGGNTGTTGKSKNAKTYDGLLKLPSVSKENRRVFQEFAVRLIGRTVFCWFLKVKKSDDGKPLVPESLLSSEALKTNANYYHTILEPLFFQTLNTPMEKRISHLPEGCKNVPFLNGGLFEQGPDDFYPKGCPWHQPNKKTALSRRGVTGSEHLNTLVIPDEWFENLFSELEKYNFTIDENSVIDVEVSVDPEMLGRIFENLLAEIDPDTGETARKATGSFYTPREIVDYMATESLLQYLHHKTSLAQAKLRPLFNMTTDHAKDVTGESLEFTSENKEALLNALDKVKILDPACGSGAFPMGVLQKMLMALEKLDPECQWWIQRQIDRVDNAILKKQIKEKLHDASVEYARKIGIIQNSLFGVDIQPIAAEISKLRCFLTLVVDEHIDETQPNRGIEPLPNLEFKFITANTLLKLPEEQDLGGLFNANEDLDTLQKLRNKYLQSCGEEKAKIKEDFGKIQAGIYKQQIDYLGKSIDVNSKAYLVSTWNPFSHVRKDSFGEKASWFDPEWMFGEKEFDLVIGNPPYVQIQKMARTQTQKDLENQNYETFKKTGDIYALFYERGLNLCKLRKGLLCYITSNKWMRAGYGEPLRAFFASKNPLQLLDFGGFKVFESATVDTNILFIQNKDFTEKPLQACHFQKDYQKGDEISEYFNKNKLELTNLSSDTWFIGSKSEIKLKQKTEKIGTPLKNWDVKINYGIKTGFNEAFIIGQAKRDELVAADPKSAEIIKPILRGRDIKRYRHEWAGKYLINSHNGYQNENGELVPPIKIEDYPAVREHLDQFSEKLKKRIDKGITPYNLRNCAYLEDFEKEKVVWQEMSKNPAFAYDTDGVFCNDTGRILVGDNVKFFIGFLNSKLFKFTFSRYYAGGGLGSEGVRYKSEFMKNFPIPKITPSNQALATQIETLVDKILSLKKENPKGDTAPLEAQIDELVFELYGLTEAERKIVS